MIARLLVATAALGGLMAIASAADAIAERCPTPATVVAARASNAAAARTLVVVVDALVDVWMGYGR